MPEWELSETAQHWANVVLIWLGFGILAGLLAKMLLPGRYPTGPMETLVIGILGSTVGTLALTLLLKDRPLNPISPLGLLAAVAGSIVALIGYRLLVRHYPIEPDE